MNKTLIQPYLFFGGRCEEALEFYRTALGAQVDFLMRYKESPELLPPGRLPPGFENKVMHATFLISRSTECGRKSVGERQSVNSSRGALSLATLTPVLDPARRDRLNCAGSRPPKATQSHFKATTKPYTRHRLRGTEAP